MTINELLTDEWIPTDLCLHDSITVKGYYYDLKYTGKIPDGYLKYEVRLDDREIDEPCSIEKLVWINHGGVFITQIDLEAMKDELVSKGIMFIDDNEAKSWCIPLSTYYNEDAKADFIVDY